jgi:CheY-like chemotaxis protein
MPCPDAPVVLIVEDEFLIRMMAADAFADAGFLVFEAEHADHALLVIADAARVHVLFTDVNMPGSMDGIDLAEHLKAATPELHVIVTSAMPVTRPIDHLMGAFVPKPYRPEAVCRTARKLLAA